MVENILVKEALSPEMIAAGRDLVEKLDLDNWPVTTAFWLFDEEMNRWRIVIASDNVETKGPRKAYERIRDVLGTVHPPAIELSDVSAVSPRDKLPKLIALAVRTNGKMPGIRLSRSGIDGHYIADAYIYKTR